ncbi:MAG: PAS domain S-box protein [Alphaproteobacteria bacterium]|jgi:PAS domain S-box-containing protein|nr:PAS domain S-box protein [Alphaproteobacteria bacterium]
MSDTDKPPKQGRGKTKEELARELEAMKRRLKKAEANGARRKQAEEALYEFEERYRNLIGGSIQGFFVHSEWNLLFANQSFASILGYRSVKELMELDDISLIFAPYEVDRLTVFRDARKRGGRVPRQYEFDAVRKDGSIVTVLNIARVVKWEGKQAIQNAVIDISDRKQAEKRVVEEKERAENYLAIAGTAILALNNNGIITLINRKGCEILGYELIELLGSKWVDIAVPEDSRKDFDREFADIIAEKTSYDVHRESAVRTKTGERRLIDWHLTVIRDSLGNITGTLSSGEDITDREQAEIERETMQLQLRQADKLNTIGTLAGGIAHDFNNILTPIIGYSHMALSELEEGTQIHSDIQRVVKGAGRAKELVNQILTFSRRGELEIASVRPSKIVQEALKLIQASCPANIEIDARIKEECPWVMGDQSQLHQVVMNLCTNAFRAMEEKGGVLTVVLEAFDVGPKFTRHRKEDVRGKYVKLSIQDNGQGMSPETLERIFEPFYTTRDVGEGTGMGLATVHGIVTAHGGEIFVDSRVGEGTTLDIYLPQAMTTAKDEDEVDVTIPKGSERILFVDDEEDITELGQQVLERAGYSVTTENNSREALRRFAKQPDDFDIVVTDQAMPNMYGIELAEEIFKLRPGFPVILISGFADTLTLESVQDRGILDFLLKPLVGHELAQAIRQALDTPGA